MDTAPSLSLFRLRRGNITPTYSFMQTASAVTTRPVLSAACQPCLISSPKNKILAPNPPPAAAQYTALRGRTTLTGLANELNRRVVQPSRGAWELLHRAQVHAAARPRAMATGWSRMSDRVTTPRYLTGHGGRERQNAPREISKTRTLESAAARDNHSTGSTPKSKNPQKIGDLVIGSISRSDFGGQLFMSSVQVLRRFLLPRPAPR